MSEQTTESARQPERDLAEVFCSLDASWDHHDRTDDYPCSACLIVARTHLAAARVDERERVKAVVEAVLAHDDEHGGGYVKAAVRTALFALTPPAQSDAGGRHE